MPIGTSPRGGANAASTGAVPKAQCPRPILGSSWCVATVPDGANTAAPLLAIITPPASSERMRVTVIADSPAVVLVVSMVVNEDDPLHRHPTIIVCDFGRLYLDSSPGWPPYNGHTQPWPPPPSFVVSKLVARVVWFARVVNIAVVRVQAS